MNTPKGAFFITGTDTDSGKTYVTARLASHLVSRGVSVITQKPVQTGCVDMAEDLEEHRRVMRCGMLPEDLERRTCTYLFRKPASPHYSARLEGCTIDTSRIAADTQYLSERYDVVLVEGAGGLMVPMNEELLTIDYVAQEALPTLLVATSKLGGINHALLSIEACKTHGVDLRAVIFNRLPKDEKEMADDALDVIKRYAPKIFPNIQVIDFRSADSFYDLTL